MKQTEPGSLRLVPKRPNHVTGDGDDGTTTRWHKSKAMKGGINLRDPVRSIRRHHRTRTNILVNSILIILVTVIGILVVGWAARHM